MSRELEKYKNDIRFLLDCGAFTAKHTGKLITLNEYCNFLDNLSIKPWRYFSLDVIGEPKKTYDNYCEMLKRGYQPLPIFTQGESLDMLDTYYSTSDVVGIGFLKTKGHKEYLKFLMRHIGKRKVHWLGFTKLDFVKKYRPYMCDSSSCNQGQRFGALHLYEKKGQSPSVFLRKDFVEKPPLKIIQTIESYGFDYRDLAKSKNWRGGQSIITKLTTASWLSLSYDIHKKLNSNMFLAVALDSKIKHIMDSYYHLMKDQI